MHLLEILILSFLLICIILGIIFVLLKIRTYQKRKTSSTEVISNSLKILNSKESVKEKSIAAVNLLENSYIVKCDIINKGEQYFDKLQLNDFLSNFSPEIKESLLHLEAKYE